jgi:hypothetical protein
MPQCPQCRKPLRELARRCPTCQADLDLLVDYVSHLSGGLERAENLTRAGDLSQAFWAYMEVLEVDPDNAAAKKQVSQVVTAVRQFDHLAEGRRWLSQVRHGPALLAWWRRLPGWALAGAFLAAVLVTFTAGYLLGFSAGTPSPEESLPLEPPPLAKDSLSGK